jgi:hypothetical protein
MHNSVATEGYLENMSHHVGSDFYSNAAAYQKRNDANDDDS